MSTALEFITRRAPEFLAHPDLAGMIQDASLNINERIYGAATYQAVGLVVCHQLALNIRNKQHAGTSPSGSVSSEKVGKLSRAFSGGFFSGTVQSSLDPYLAQTTWGIELFNLQQSLVPAFFSRRF